MWFSPVVFFKQKTAYEMRISDWSSDVCSSDLAAVPVGLGHGSGCRRAIHPDGGAGRRLADVAAQARAGRHLTPGKLKRYCAVRLSLAYTGGIRPASSPGGNKDYSRVPLLGPANRPARAHLVPVCINTIGTESCRDTGRQTGY